MTHKVKPVGKTANQPLKIDEKKLREFAGATGLSNEFLKKVIDFEGFRTNHYNIADGNTIGIGHYMDDDPNFKARLKRKEKITISETQVYSLFKQDLLRKKAEIRELLKSDFDSLNRGQQEALVDLSFNLKPSALKNSQLVKAISNHQFKDALKEFTFVKAGGKVLPGLCKRRIYDIERFADGTHPDNAKIAINDIVLNLCSDDSSALVAPGQQAIENLEMAWVTKKSIKHPFVAMNR